MLMLLTSCQPKEAANPTSIEYASLRVGTLYGPQIYMSTDHGNTGFDYDMVNKFSQFINKPLKMQPYHSLAELYLALDNNEIDLIAAGLTESKKRKQKYRLSPPLYQVDQVLIFRKGTNVPHSVSELNGELTVLANSSFVETLEECQMKISALNWQETHDHNIEELLEMVANKTITYTITDSTSLQINRRFMPKLRQGLVLKKDLNVVWLVSQNDSHQLMSQILNFWDQIKRSDTLEQLYERYFGHVQRFDYVDTRAFIRAVNTKLPQYLDWFKKHSGELDWRKLAATSYQESHWKPHARSRTGVRGMMMLTLPTAKQMGIKNRLDPEQSIKGGAQYLLNILRRLPKSIPENQKIWFALASYNLGMGHVEDARVIAEKKGLNPSSWKDVKKVLPLLQKHNYYNQTRYGYARGSEAVHYVDSIRRYYDTLVWLDKQKDL